MSIFGRILPASRVERAVADTLKRWLSTYLAELEDQEGIERGEIERPNSYVTVNDFDHELGQQLPSIVIDSGGTSDRPVRGGDGQYSVPWSIEVNIIATGNDERSAKRLTRLYAAAIRAVIVQRPSLDGEIGSVAVTWTGEGYDVVAESDDGPLAAAVVLFSIEIEDVVTHGAGPADPTPLPGDPPPEYPDWPTVETVGLVVQPKET